MRTYGRRIITLNLPIQATTEHKTSPSLAIIIALSRKHSLSLVAHLDSKCGPYIVPRGAI